MLIHIHKHEDMYTNIIILPVFTFTENLLIVSWFLYQGQRCLANMIIQTTSVHVCVYTHLGMCTNQGFQLEITISYFINAFGYACIFTKSPAF